MAILDTLFGGSSQAELLGGLLGEDKLNQLRSQATQTGLINAAIGYLAQPKNQRFGSALPYLARAFTAGQQGAQGVYDDALKNWQIQQKVDEFNRDKAARAEFEKAKSNLFTTIPAQYQEMVTPGGYAPQQTEVQSGQVFPNFGLTKLPDVTQKVMTAPERQVFNEQALQQMILSGDPRATSYLTGLKTIRDITKSEKGESPFAKIDPKDYTTESLSAYVSTGDITQLRPKDGTKVKDFGADIESVSMARYQRPYSQLTQPEMAAVLKEVNEGKTSRVPKVEVNLADPTAVAKAGIELSEKAQKFFKEDIDTASQYNIIKSLAKNPTPTGDTTLLYSLFKVLDPTSTVREGEVNMVMESRSIPARLKGYAQKLAGGGNLLPRERQEILSIAEQRVSIRKKNFEKSRRAFVENAKRLKLDPEIYVPNPYSEMQGSGGNQGTVEVDY